MSKYIGTPVVNISADTVDVTGDITTTDSTPEVIIVNNTHEDTDGGREGKVTFKGQQSGGEETTLAQIQASHDGTSDDEKGDLIFKTNDGSDGASPTERMRIDSGGNVGIGTSSPNTLLTVEGTDTEATSSQMLKVRNTTTGEAVTIGLYAKADNGGDGNTGSITFDAGADGSSANNELRFSADHQTNTTPDLTILGNGNVGIGTSSPSSPLQIQSSNNQIRLVDSQNTSMYCVIETISDAGLSFNADVAGAAASSRIQFNVDNSEKMRIDNDGKVGIGTTTPTGNANASAVVLEVNSTSGSSPPEILAGGQNAEISIAGGNAASYLWSTGSYPLVMATNSTERARITNTGSFFVGTSSGSLTSEGVVLGYNGTQTNVINLTSLNQAHIYNNNNSTGTTYKVEFRQNNTAVGNIAVGSSSTAYNTTSDYRLKENVTDVTDGITRVKQLSPKQFNFIADADTTVDGFLAHEVQTVVPEAITGTHNEVEVWAESEELPDGVSVGDNKLDDDGNTIPVYQGIDQAKLVPLLTAALQEAIAKIETLETKVTALEGA